MTAVLVWDNACAQNARLEAGSQIFRDCSVKPFYSLGYAILIILGIVAVTLYSRSNVSGAGKPVNAQLAIPADDAAADDKKEAAERSTDPAAGKDEPK